MASSNKIIRFGNSNQEETHENFVLSEHEVDGEQEGFMNHDELGKVLVPEEESNVCSGKLEQKRYR